MAAGATYEPIATQTLASAAASITFSSIAASWTDLRVVFAVHPTAASSVSICYRFNGDTASNYSDTLIKGNGASASSSRHTSQTYLYTAYGSTAVAAGYALVTTDIFSYAGSTFKTLLNTFANDKNGSGDVNQSVGLWRSTSAITSIAISSDDGAQFDTGTTATLYGIKAA